tara:strand:- start:19607 stop:20983 length:1377 start_codon:yes stop_codon:yes gene_type:complete
MKRETPTFAHFGKTFQEGLARLIMDERVFSDQISDVLDVEFFEHQYLRVFTRQILQYKEKYDSHPTRSTIASVLNIDLKDEPEVVVEQVKSFFARATATHDEVENSQFIKDHSLDFCKRQKVKEAMLKSVSLVDKCSFEEVEKTLTDALKLGVDNDHGHDYKRDKEDRYVVRSRNPVSTGWSEIDSLLRGGLGRGELGVIIAPTGVGKSMALVHLGAQAVQQGLSVIHYTLEMPAEDIGLRYDACITQTPLRSLHGLKDDILEEVDKVPGSLVVKEYPTKSASSLTLKAHLDKLRRREVPIDMIIVDYGDLLRAKSTQREKRHELESIYEEIRALGMEHKCPVWTASQTNRSGVEADLVGTETIAEAFSKCHVADFICGLSRTTTQKNNNQATMNVCKNRGGQDGRIFPMLMDTSRVRLEVLPYQGDTPEGIRAINAKEQHEHLQSQYKELMGSQKRS